MKTAVIILTRITLLTLLCLFTVGAHSQEDSSGASDEAKLTKYFKGLDLKELEGKRVDSFLKAVVPTFTRFELAASRHLEYKGLIIFHYPGDLFVHVYVTEFRFVNPNGMSRRRNLRNLKKEKMTAIQIHNGLACLEGCD